MARVHNFSAGPAALPEEVLKECADELLDFQGSGMSVLEMSHRSATYQAVIDDAEATLRRLLGLSDDWAVMFLQGGATLEFAGVPLNLMHTGTAGYVVSGHFAQKAAQEGAKYGDARVLASSEDAHFSRIPDLAPVNEACAAGGLDYLHICQNNTIFGTMYHELPETADVPLVADVSSCFLGLPLDVDRYGAIYAGAQKNAGPAGVTVVLVRKALLEAGPLPICPTYLNWQLEASKGSMYNTPNTFGIYVCGKVFRWVEREGGLAEMERRNRTKADLLYAAIDGSDVFHGTADSASRSICNVTFTTGDPALDKRFVGQAAEEGLVGLGGHRLVGGMRASIYNAVRLESVEALVALMQRFEQSA